MLRAVKRQNAARGKDKTMMKVIGSGRLTADPEIRYTQNNTCIARFSLAVSRRFKREGDPEADFHRCVAFGKTAQFIERYIRKGMKIEICGRLENESWENRDGVKVTSANIVIEECDFAESKNAASRTQAPAQGRQQAAPAQKKAQGSPAPAQQTAPAADNDWPGFFGNGGFDEELPFT